MKDYLIIINRYDFTDFFKFGYKFIDSETAIEFNGKIENLHDNSELRESVFSKVNPFEYTFTVLILHFQSKLSNPCRVNIEDVLHIFPLDLDSKKEIEDKFDSRIRIEDPIWQDYVHELQEKFLLESFKKGAINLWRALRIEQNLDDVSLMLSEKDLEELAREAFSDRRPMGDLSYWVYLLRYERHGFFPQTSLGYIYDLVNVYINYVSKKEQLPEAIESTAIFGFLEQLDQDMPIIKIYKSLINNPVGEKFYNAVNSVVSIDSDVFIVSVLFLIFKKYFIGGFQINQASSSIIGYAKENFPRDYPKALYLLGIFLGNEHTYEFLYEQLPLPIFKQLVAPHVAPQTDDKEPGNTGRKKSAKSPSNNNPKEQSLFPDDQITSDIKPQIMPTYMRKSKRGKPRFVETIKDFYKLIKQGYYEVKPK